MLTALERAGWPDQPLPGPRAGVPSDDAGSSVTALRRPNRKLKPSEVDDLVARYQTGASIRSLGLAFGLHEQKVRGHLVRRGVSLRPVRALTAGQEDTVVRLYIDDVQTLTEIADKFGVGEDVVLRVLVRRGVPRRSRARRKRQY